MDITLLTHALINLISIAFPNNSTIAYDFVGFNKASDWEFMVGNDNGTQVLFADAYQPLWFVIITNSTSSKIDRAIQERDTPDNKYVVVSLTTEEPTFDLLDIQLDSDMKCFADLTSTMYCFGKEDMAIVSFG